MSTSTGLVLYQEILRLFPNDSFFFGVTKNIDNLAVLRLFFVFGNSHKCDLFGKMLIFGLISIINSVSRYHLSMYSVGL